MADDGDMIDAEFVEQCRCKLSLSRNSVANRWRSSSAVTNQISTYDTVMCGERWSDTVPPVDRRAEAVQQQYGWSFSFYPDVGWLNACVDNLAALAWRCRPCAGVDPDRIC